MTELQQYLGDIKRQLRLEPTSEREIIRELETHIEEESEELCEAGFTPEEATKIVTARLGSSQSLARGIHRVHCRGAWLQALLTALPLLLIALTFAFHLWYDWQCVALLSTSIVGFAIYKWRRDRPVWLYPWLGYCFLLLLLLPLFLWGGLPHLWFWLLLPVYIPLALWLVCFIVVRVIRRDWLFASVMMLPLPVVISWLITLEGKGGIYSEQAMQNSSTPIALTFLCLGLAIAISTRLRQRWLKIGLLLTATLAILIAILIVNGPAFLALAFFLTSLFFTPKLLERRIGHRECEGDVREQCV